jgi:endonuclease YncB( thermonuclease family)
LKHRARLVLAFALLQLGTPARAASTISATVLSIGDGDTLRVRHGSQRLTVRLACIDAPEMSQGQQGLLARQSLQQALPLGSSVLLKLQTTDRYGRAVAEVISERPSDHRPINLTLVAEGRAFTYRQYLRQCDAQAYLAAEAEARRLQRGVWEVPGGMTRPWDYRAARRQPVAHGSLGGTVSNRKLRCRDIGSYAKAQDLLRQGHSYLDANGDGQACESLR